MYFYMCRYSNDLLNELWEKANPVDGYDSTLVRKAPCGAWIQRISIMIEITILVGKLTMYIRKYF